MPTNRRTRWVVHWIPLDNIVEPVPADPPDTALPRDRSSSAPLALLCPIDQGYALLVGLGANSRAVLAGDGRQRCLMAPAVSAEERNALRLLDMAAQRDDAHAQVELVARLAGLGVPGRQIAELLAIDVSRACRLGRLADSHGSLKEAVFSRRLSPGHARPLLKMPLFEQARWVERAIQGKWSVETLIGAIAGERRLTASSADNASLARQVGEVLGANVSIEGAQGAGELMVDWFSVEDLKQVLRRLGGGSETQRETILEPRRRTLRIQFQSPDELEDILSGLALAQ